jgi:hypothetical protein
LIVNAHFTISKAESILLLAFTGVTTYCNYNGTAFNEPVQVTVEGDTLIVGFLCCDNFQDWYVRTKHYS